MRSIDRRFRSSKPRWSSGIRIAARSQDPHDDALAVQGGDRGHAEVEPPSLHAHADPPVLWQAALRDVQLRHDLDPRGDRRPETLGRGLGVEEHAVDPVPDPKGVLEGLDVHVGGVRLDRVLDQEVDQTDHRGVERHVPEGGHVLAARVVSAILLAHGLDDLLDRGGAGAEVPLDRLEDRAFHGHREADVESQRAAQLVDHGRVGRIGAGDHEHPVLDGQWTEAVLAHVLRGQPLEEGRGRRELVPTDVGDLEVPGERLRDLLGARQPKAHQRVGQALPGGLAVRFGPRQLCLREEPGAGQPASKGRGVAGFHEVTPRFASATR